MANSSILDINSILNDYCKDIQDGIEEETIRLAKQGVSELKATSPKNKKKTRHQGKYAKGWRVKTEKSFGHINCTIHNATDYQLTHLLEKEHLTRNGGKTKAIVHIAPVEEKIVSEYQRNVEKVIKNGG